MIENLDRRNFLKFGAAFPLALKILETRSPAKKTAPPKRIIFICNSLGFYKPYFFPRQAGDLATSDYLKELDTQEKLTVFQNLFHPGMETSNHDSEKAFLTGSPSPEATGFINNISLDQVLAREIGNSTRFPFLSFSIYDRGWGCSWNDRGSAIPPLHDEQQIFNMLFGPEDLRAKKRQLANDQQILDCLRRDLATLTESGDPSGRLGHYRSLVREMEAQLEHDRFWLKTNKPRVEESLSNDREFEFSTKIHNLFELAKLAFRTDSTRVISFSMDWIYGAIKVPGATDGWHSLSHHGGKQDKLDSLSRVEIDIVRHFNQFLVDLEAIPEGDGTLLDQTTVVLGSNFGDASNHTCHNLPIIVAGGGHRHRQHRVLDQPAPLCNLYLELLHDFNIDVGQFGSGEKNMNLLRG